MYTISQEADGGWAGIIGNTKVCVGPSEESVRHALVTNYGMPKFVGATKSDFTVEERFNFIEIYVTLLVRGVINSMIVTGDGGLGKTYTVINSLKELGLTEVTEETPVGHFIQIKGYSTAKAMYRALWENNGGIIVFDDCDSIHKDANGANILKSALDSYDRRVISWGADFGKNEELPNRFEFTGRCIFISNLTQRQFPQAMLSRSMRVDLTLTLDEKLERIEQILRQNDDDEDVVEDVMGFLTKYASVLTDLNIRSALNVLKIRENIEGDWERVALYTASA